MEKHEMNPIQSFGYRMLVVISLAKASHLAKGTEIRER